MFIGQDDKKLKDKKNLEVVHECTSKPFLITWLS